MKKQKTFYNERDATQWLDDLSKCMRVQRAVLYRINGTMHTHLGREYYDDLVRVEVELR